MKKFLALSLVVSLTSAAVASEGSSAAATPAVEVGYLTAAKNAVVNSVFYVKDSAVNGACYVKDAVVATPGAVVNGMASYAPGFGLVQGLVTRITGEGEGFFARNSKNISAAVYASVVAAVAYAAYAMYTEASEEDETF